MMSVPLLDLKEQYRTIRDEIRTAIDRVCESQQFILGPEVEALETEIRNFCGSRFAEENGKRKRGKKTSMPFRCK